jgi:hypothetical protein
VVPTHAAADGARWQLPIRLKILHSLWYDHNREVMLFRPPHFQERTVEYMAIGCANQSKGGAGKSSPGDGHAKDHTQKYSCYRVPPHLHKTYWPVLLLFHRPKLRDELVGVRRCRVTEVLSKIERMEYIHHYQRSEPSPMQSPAKVGDAAAVEPHLIFELPRLRLAFELSAGGEILSRDFDGYRLRPCQQLVEEKSFAPPGRGPSAIITEYTLPGFEQYLVLQRCSEASTGDTFYRSKRAELLVLVPSGKVQRDGPRTVIDVTDDANAVVKVALAVPFAIVAAVL